MSRRLEQEDSASPSTRFDKLSSVVGLPVISASIFSELSSPDSFLKHNFTLVATLGISGDEYGIKATITLSDKYHPGSYQPLISWSVKHNLQEIFRVGELTSYGDKFSTSEVDDPDQIQVYLSKELDRILGGPRTDIHYMDYESYSVGQLQNDKCLFSSAYLIIMVHLKERGITLPPILGKQPAIQEMMSSGHLIALDRTLNSITLFEASQLESRLHAHLIAEAAAIRRQAVWESRRRNPNVPLESSYRLRSIKIDRGEKMYGPYNLLVVEKDIHHLGLFTNLVKNSLNLDGRYLGTSLITEFGYPDCISLCETGKIDLVIFDWSPLDYWELLRFQGARNNFFNLIYGASSAGNLYTDNDGQLNFELADGRTLKEDELIAEADSLDLSSLWMAQVARACLKASVAPPPYLTARTTSDKINLATMITSRLGHILR